jgi:putative ABC transport system ATP-binding protein
MEVPAVEVTDLVKQYNERDAVLKGVTFALNPGEFVTLFGKSGCGKTTLLNIVGGLDRPTSGDVRIEGLSTVGMSEDRLARLRLDKIGFVFQDYNLLSGLTVRENIALPLQLSGKKVQRDPDELMKDFRIDHIAKETPNRISGGEAQRVAIARAMMNEPKVILADEPTGNLDAENTMKVIDAFKLIIKEFGTTVLLATHDKDLSVHSSSVIQLDMGKTVTGRQTRG